MKKTSYFNIMSLMILVCVCAVSLAFLPQKTLSGGYEANSNNGQEAIIFQDGYFMHTSYNTEQKKFHYSQGGTFKVTPDSLILNIEFSTQSKDDVGTRKSWAIKSTGDALSITRPEASLSFKKVDEGNTALAGNWRITGRKQGETMSQMQRGARKTLKLLSGTRFQWAAINPETKEFFGTGGGTYTFKDGRYTETIQFFSRDSSRVGATLSFDGAVKGNDWHHSGLSSKGEPIYEVWSREK